jgi:hypothetical protein
MRPSLTVFEMQPLYSGAARAFSAEGKAAASRRTPKRFARPAQKTVRFYSAPSAAYAMAMAMSCGLPPAGPGNAFMMTAMAMS